MLELQDKTRRRNVPKRCRERRVKPYYSDELITLFNADFRNVSEWLGADVLITDPPYGIPGGRISRHKTSPVHADAKWDDLKLREDALRLWGSRPRAVFGSPKWGEPPTFRGVPLVWDKGEVPGLGDLTWPFGATYELIWIDGPGWSGRRRSSILRSTHSSSAATTEGHPTPKPVGLIETLICYARMGSLLTHSSVPVRLWLLRRIWAAKPSVSRLTNGTAR